MESEETQDYVREGKSTEHEEEEERTFVPSAVSVPLNPLFRCDNQCSEKTLSYWQVASVEVNEGDEAYTTNLCQKCFNKHLQAKRKEPLTKCEVEAGCGKEGVSRKFRKCTTCTCDTVRTIFSFEPCMRSHEVSRAHKTKTLRAGTKLKGKGINGTSACQLTRAQQALHKI